MAYIPINLGSTDTDTVIDEVLDGIAARIPGWSAHETAPETALGEEDGRLAAETRIVTALAAQQIFGWFGKSLMGLAQTPAVAATVATTWTATTSAGVTIPAGTRAVWDDGAGTQVMLTLPAATAVAAGDTTVDATMQAVAAGSAGNAVTAGTLMLVDGVAQISGVVATAAGAGGTDAETDDAYATRLAAWLDLPRTPVLGADFAAIARETAGVHRAMALDGWDTVGGTTGNARTVGLAAITADGSDVSGAVKTALAAALAARREANFIVGVGAPTYTAIATLFTAVSDTGSDAASVRAAAEQSVKDLLSPATWDGGSLDPPVWNGNTKVKYLDVVAAVARTPGIAAVTSLTINGGTADITMSGKAPLPAKFSGGTPSTVTGTVT